jgi:hypothetical protein
MAEQDGGLVVCYWCRQEVAADSYLCPNCGRQPQPEGISPLGGEPAQGVPDTGGMRAPSPIRDPRAAYERRRAERLAAQAEREEMGYGSYLRWLVREDQVFGVLLGLLALNVVASAALVFTSWGSGIFIATRLASLLINIAVLLGVLSLSRWVHTALVWLLATYLLLSLIGVIGLVLAPLMVSSGWQLLLVWARTIFGLASMLFVLVVLCERSAYFGGMEGRAGPKRTKLRDFLRRGYWEEALARPGERPPVEPEAPRRRREEMRPAPQGQGRAEMPRLRDGREKPEAMRGSGEAEELEGLGPFGGEAGPAPPSQGPTGAWRVGVGDRYRVEPLPPAPGQAGSGLTEARGVLSVEHVRTVVTEDRTLGWALGAMGLQLVLIAFTLNLWAILGAVAVIWGVLAFQRWGLWLALATSMVQVGGHAIVLAALRVKGLVSPGALAYFVVIFGLNLLIVVVLIARRERFI